MVNKKPYFFIYNYDRLKNDYNVFMNNVNKTPRRTETLGLKKLEIRLQTNYWESE